MNREALGSCGLDVASARKSRGPGVGEHEALARVFLGSRTEGCGGAVWRPTPPKQHPGQGYWGAV